MSEEKQVGKMSQQEAFNVLVRVGREFRGTAQEHEVIREALLTIKDLLDGEEVVETPEVEAKKDDKKQS